MRWGRVTWLQEGRARARTRSSADLAQFLSISKSDIYLKMWEILKIGTLKTHGSTYFRAYFPSFPSYFALIWKPV